VVRHPDRLDVHRLRLKAALRVSGTELVQGALADLFYGCRHSAGAAERREALQWVQPQLNPLVARRFESHVERCTLAQCNALATRHSVLTTPTLDAPQRLLRCSTDDSKALASATLRAWHAGDAAAQEAFLLHCRVCRDVLAFMLVRRDILRSGHELPAAWRAMFTLLQQEAVAA